MHQASHTQVQQVAPIGSVNTEQQQERVVQGEVLGKETKRARHSGRTGFTVDAQRQDHPGFYSKRQYDPTRAQQAINAYTDMSDAYSPVAPSTVDYFV